MKRITIAFARLVAAALAFQSTQALALDANQEVGAFSSESAEGKAGGNKMVRVKVDCANDSKALKNALEKKAWNADKVRFVISGECNGPLVIDRNGFEVVGDAHKPAAVRISQSNREQAAILIQSASARFANFNVDVPGGTAAIKAKANASVTVDRITTNAQSDWAAPMAQLVATDSSSLFLANLSGSEVLVIGGSTVEFESGNTRTTLDVRDTSTAKSGHANEFSNVQLSANAYLLADNRTRIDTLGIWGKASVEIDRDSRVGQLGMGGQTMFAAYRNSSVSGPYAIYGNVVIEINNSTATGWKTVSNPHAMFIGSNATVNNQLYPDWSWSGQDGLGKP
ncbi:hypothetical protein [Jeongeupia naejangsanensis]